MSVAQNADSVARELSWTRERLLLVPLSESPPAFLAQDYARLEERKRALEEQVRALLAAP